MPILEPPPAPPSEIATEEQPFQKIRQYVLTAGETEAVRELREETRNRLGLIRADYPGMSGWTYFGFFD